MFSLSVIGGNNRKIAAHIGISEEKKWRLLQRMLEGASNKAAITTKWLKHRPPLSNTCVQRWSEYIQYFTVCPRKGLSDQCSKELHVKTGKILWKQCFNSQEWYIHISIYFVHALHTCIKWAITFIHLDRKFI